MTQVLIDRATLEQLVGPLEEANSDTQLYPGHPGRWVTAIEALRAALAGAEPKPKMLSDILKDTL